jgi:hypothetical protein
VKNHLQMLCSLFLANILQRDHPSHDVVMQPQGPHEKKNTLYSKCIGDVQHHLQDGVIPTISYKSVIEAIHTDSVAAAINSYPPNKVLGVCPLRWMLQKLHFQGPINVLCTNSGLHTVAI